jgi:hypothetical protein
MSIKVRVCVEMAGASGASGASGESGERADKTIWVSVAEFDGLQTAGWGATEHTVNGTHTVQEAVAEVYAGFRKMCRRVVVRRGGEIVPQALWYKGDPEAVWERDLYETIADGDEVVIVKGDNMPGGPRKEEEGAEARGPQRARMVDCVCHVDEC